MQGTNYQIDKEPLLQIPIAVGSDMSKLVKVVDEILVQLRFKKDITDLEQKVNRIVFSLYELTDSEIAFVENDMATSANQ